LAVVGARLVAAEALVARSRFALALLTAGFALAAGPDVARAQTGIQKTVAPAPVAAPAAPAAPVGPTAPAATPATIDVATLAALLARQQEEKRTLITVFDVNSPKTRAEQGVIPGSVMLESSSSFDLDLLGKDKAQPLVFYCSHERCTASKTAALRALAEGFTQVSVLPVGIAGWLKAGQVVDKPVG
jgi:rhodanese-related sulfurtransferase